MLRARRTNWTSIGGSTSSLTYGLLLVLALIASVALGSIGAEGAGAGTSAGIEWLESYEAALDEARVLHQPPRWVLLIVRDDARWSQELLRRLEHAKEAVQLSRSHFVMAHVTEDALPPAARLQFNQLAPYAPSAFFIDPEGQVRTDLVNRFAPADQDPVYKYFYKTATPLVRMMKLVVEQEQNGVATVASDRQEL